MRSQGFKNWMKLCVVMNIFNPSTKEGEADKPLWVPGQPRLHYIVRAYLKTKTKQKLKKKNELVCKFCLVCHYLPSSTDYCFILTIFFEMVSHYIDRSSWSETHRDLPLCIITFRHLFFRKNASTTSKMQEVLSRSSFNPEAQIFTLQKLHYFSLAKMYWL